MKKIQAYLLTSVICLFLIGCSSDKTDNSVNTSSEEPVVSEKTLEEQKASDNVSEEQTTTENVTEIDNTLINSYNIFDVTSDNLHDGNWDDIISNTDKGSNRSPQLSWEPVEGASTYMVYMVDTSMEYWIHWKSYDVKDTTLPEGWAPESDYVGPWPPAGGSHTYEIYVIALKNPIDRMKGSLNGQNPRFATFIDAADTDADGNTGNIVGAAHISGIFTN